MTLEEFKLSPHFRPVMAYLHSFKPHKHHKHTVDLSKDYVAYVTGEGLDDMLRQFTRRESTDLFEQRKKLTQHVIPCTVGRVLDVFKKVERTSYKRKIEIRKDGSEDGNDEKAQGELIDIIGKFHGGRPLDKYIFETMLQLNSIDPNAFIVIEWAAFDANYERAKPYPFEVRSENVADYAYENGILKRLTVSQKVKVGTEKKEAEVNKVTVYLENQTIVFRQLAEFELRGVKAAGFREKDFRETDVEGVYFHLNNGHYFEVTFPVAHELGVVPALRVGYIPNLANKKATMVSLYQKAVPLLRKSIKANSELDLTMALAAFPLPVSYRDPCTAVGCSHGKLPDDSTCGTCKGTGWMRSTSVQEEMVFKKPKNPQDAFKLSDMMHYVSPPIELITFQDKYLDDLSRRAISTVFNSDIFSRQEIADTATGKNISLQNVYDSLVALGDHISWAWWLFVEIISKITDLNDGLEHELVISKDFKLKGLSDVLEDLKLATDSGASPEAIQALQVELMRLLLSDEEFARYEVAAEFNPFRGLSTEQVQLALNSNYTTKRSKVLYLNLNTIISDIERESPKFYTLPFDAKKKLIDAKVEALILELPTSEVPIMNGV